jgi:hypothetical protein
MSSLVQTSTVCPRWALAFVINNGRNIPCRAWAYRYVALPKPGWERAARYIATLQNG